MTSETLKLPFVAVLADVRVTPAGARAPAATRPRRSLNREQQAM
ncbi:hypothetical protein QLH51_15970 [Sphingomonas sp. 2R-10]|nr:hypothetical protein [Sphingomonas sp. 2R-10]MDJ0278297.1 hypothetical protein [Sphingomonas sp. 2R-10]